MVDSPRAVAFVLTPGMFPSFSYKLNVLIPDQRIAAIDTFFAALARRPVDTNVGKVTE